MSQFFREIARQIILSKTFTEALTHMMAVEIERQVKGIAGGDSLYIHKSGSREDKRERNRLIRAQFTGDNHTELCRRFHLSRSQLYAIVKVR